MNTTGKKDFDYQAYIKNKFPDPAEIKRGSDERRKRFESAKMKNIIRIDEDILEQFRQFSSEGQGCEKLINQALREWLSAVNVEEIGIKT